MDERKRPNVCIEAVDSETPERFLVAGRKDAHENNHARALEIEGSADDRKTAKKKREEDLEEQGEINMERDEEYAIRKDAIEEEAWKNDKEEHHGNAETTDKDEQSKSELKVRSIPRMPTKQERLEHEALHANFKEWSLRERQRAELTAQERAKEDGRRAQARGHLSVLGLPLYTRREPGIDTNADDGRRKDWGTLDKAGRGKRDQRRERVDHLGGDG